MLIAMALWLRVAPLAISRATMSKPMSIMVPPIIIKIIMEMADSAKITISLAQAPHQWTIITNASTPSLVMDSHILGSQSSLCMTLFLRKRKRSPSCASNSRRPSVIELWPVPLMHSSTWWASSNNHPRISSRTPCSITSSIKIRSSRIIRCSQGAPLRSHLRNPPNINNISIISIRRVRR